ncbi:GPP34 family phosphoprotein [Glycomyces mayteni]|uniref:GPP34 family phosphoprotein n=1 Tax=Glycomyces mayteni TaxID=543887 RepID=A0ABW2DF42_9ACTN|nr:hypothetical protein GCM10025732_39730 [Glycomyces mayteni]
MLIVEDLLLLLLDDEKGHIAGEGTLYYPLGGAVLMDLALAGSVRFEEGSGAFSVAKVHAVAGAAPEDDLLADAYAVAAPKPRTVNELLILIGTKLRTRVADRLVDKGLVRRDTKKVLGLFRSTTWPAADAAHEEELRGRVKAVLVGGEEPDARTGAVIALLSASGSLHQVLHYDELKWTELDKRARAVVEGRWAAEAVRNAITATNAAVASAATAAAVTIATQ